MCRSDKIKLVTGGGGFLGKAIVKRLLAKGNRVRSFSRQHYPELHAMGVDQFQGDLSDQAAVDAACQGVGTIYHVAAKPGVWGPYSHYYRANVLGTENIIRISESRKIEALIYTSSPSVIFDGNDMEGVDESIPYPREYHAHYPKTKAMAEKKVIEAARNGLPAIILRPHLIWGPGDNHLVPRILKRAKKLRRIGNRRNLVDTIYIDNAAEAHTLAEKRLMENPSLSGNIYFISQDAPIPLWEMVDLILESGGQPPVKKTISPRIAYIAGALMEFFYKLLRLSGEPMMTRFVANELATAHWFDIRAAKRDLGYAPKVSTEQGLARLAEWIRKERPGN